MKKPEELRAFLQRVDGEVTKSQNEIKKIKKKITRLNKEMRVLRKRVKTHKHAQTEASPDAVILLKVPARGKKAQQLNSVLIQIQTDGEKKPRKGRRYRRKAGKEDAQVVRHGRKKAVSKKA